MKKLTTNEFIEKARKVHGDKYDYSKVEYQNSDTRICIICPIHGEFYQVPYSHLSGSGCKRCAEKEKHMAFTKNNKHFIEKSQKVHGNKYDYSKVEYINRNEKVRIICPIHGEFWQRPANHYEGKGCPKCNASKLEKEVETLLASNKIEYETQKKFKWLGRLSLDFFLPKYNIAIECQGGQHYKPVNFFGGIKKFIKQKERDKRKLEETRIHNIKIIYVNENNKTNFLKEII